MNRARLTRSELAPEIAAARKSLVSTLESLKPQDWDAPSLCSEWAIRDVVGHLLHQYDLYRHPLRVVGVVRAGFRVNRYLANEGRRFGEREISELVSALEGAEFEGTTVWKRYQYPVYALSEFVIHAQDIRRPLEISEKPSVSQLEIVAEIFARPPRSNPFARIFNAKLPQTRFEAIDSDWSYGDGPVVRGPLEAIAMVLAGRSRALTDLAGDGVPGLREALTP